MSGSIAVAIQKLLGFLSGGLCAFPGCGLLLWVEDEAGNPTKVRADIAHISGEKPGSARYDPQMSEAERSALPNLMFLCPNHHDEIDKNEGRWTTATLVGIKQLHEARVRAALGGAMGEVSSTELDVVVRGIATGDYFEPSDFSVVEIATKLNKNNLSQETGVLLRLGMASARDVGRYLDRMSEVDANIGERLKASFQACYREEAALGARGDVLFEKMREFATKGYKELRLQAAALAVLAYLFEACEVFER